MEHFPIELVFLLVAGLISLINWLVERAAKIRKEAAKAQKRRETRPGVDLENLGSPRPPPEEPARETPQKLPLPEPRLPIPPPIGGPEAESEQPRPKPKRPTPATPELGEVGSEEIGSAGPPPAPRRRRRPPHRRRRSRAVPAVGPAPVAAPARGGRRASWRQLLRHRAGARTGFVLGEILGPPVARRRGALPPR